MKTTSPSVPQSNSELDELNDLAEMMKSLHTVDIDDLPELPPATIYPQINYFPEKEADDQEIEDEEIYGDTHQIQSMKAVSKTLREMGVKVTWTSFHRYCMEQAHKSPEELKRLLATFGISKQQLHKIIIMFVPNVLIQRLGGDLNTWYGNKGTTKRASSHHFFDDFTHENKEETFKYVRSRLVALSEEIKSSHGHNDNIAYLQGVYENALRAFSGVLPDNFNPCVWMHAVNASHDATVSLIPSAAYLYVTRKIASQHGEHYTNEDRESRFKEDSDIAARSIFFALRIGPGALKQADDAFELLSLKYKNKKISQQTFVMKAMDSTIEVMEKWCGRAYNDAIAHAMVMDHNFCAYFEEHFQVPIWDKRFQIACAYKKL